MRDNCSRLSLGIMMLFATSTVRSEQLVVGASRDNTIFSESNNSGGGATTFIAGRTNGGDIRRALLHFDISGVVPPSATVTSAALAIRLDRVSPSETQARDIGLHRLVGDWGEGVSGAGGSGGGQGSAPTAGGATWLNSSFDTAVWSVSGGDFFAAPSGTSSVGTAVEFYQWPSTPELVADVQGWLDDPTSNYGWALLSDESQNGTARRFNSREAIESFRPALTVEFTAVPEPSAILMLAFASLLSRYWITPNRHSR